MSVFLLLLLRCLSRISRFGYTLIETCLQRPPRSAAGGEPRKNPERTTRRQTRSMGGVDPSPAKEEELELSLEEELLEVSSVIYHRAVEKDWKPL